MTDRTLDFYFDFISPFSYLAQVKLPGIAERYGCSIDYRPIEIPEAKIAAGNYGPSNREIGAKIRVLTADLMRWATRYGVELNFPASFDCEDWNCAAVFAREEGKAGEFVSRAYDRIWGKGIDPGDRDELKGCASAAGLDPEALISFVESSEGQTEYRKTRAEAYERGVFGAPMIFVDDEVFWGNDRLDFLEEYLQERK